MTRYDVRHVPIAAAAVVACLAVAPAAHAYPCSYTGNPGAYIGCIYNQVVALTNDVARHATDLAALRTDVDAVEAALPPPSNRVIDFLHSDLTFSGTYPDAVTGIPVGPYVITTSGNPVRVTFKARSLVYHDPSTPIIAAQDVLVTVDGEPRSACDGTGTMGWGAYGGPVVSYIVGSIVCDAVLDLPAGDYTIAFELIYSGHETTLYGGQDGSLILIEELL